MSCLQNIAKKEEVLSYADFKPISQCNASYKILAKVIAIRLQGTLPDIISNKEVEFLVKRNVNSSILLAQELMQNLQSTYNKRNYIMKMDMIKS